MPDDDFMIDIPDEAERLLETILIPYGRRSIWSLSNSGGRGGFGGGGAGRGRY